MKISELLTKAPDFVPFYEQMPEEVRQAGELVCFPEGSTIHHKLEPLQRFGIIALGATKVINEFPNGSTFLIETNYPVDFIGEVVVFSRSNCTSVRIDAVTDTWAFMIPRAIAEKWIFSNPFLMAKIGEKIAKKLYRSSFSKGMSDIYPAKIVFADYLLRSYRFYRLQQPGPFVLQRTRELMSEDTGLNIKSINRIITDFKKDNLICLTRGKVCLTEEKIPLLEDLLHQGECMTFNEEIVDQIGWDGKMRF